MLRKFIICSIIVFIITGCSENNKDSSAYDEQLSLKLEADEYGMRRYVIAFLKAGSNRGQDSTTAMQLQKAHLDNITRLADEGKLVLAGPFLENQELRGIYIFAVSTVEEARELTATDPAIKEGRLVMELHPWYGSAALMKLNNIHKKLSKKPL
jgi:uncharacterized protein YciI